MSGTTNIPLAMTTAGPQPTPLSTLNATIISVAQGLAPGLTVLPAGLIEDMSSTATGATYLLDQARVDCVNSVTPYAANASTLAQQGAMLGLPQGGAQNGSVYVTFGSTAGLYIPVGFVVSDGTNQYTVQDGGAVATGGFTSPLYCVAQSSGDFPIPAGSVTTPITTISGYTITCTNALAGTPGTGQSETVSAYRSRVIQALGFAVQGTASAMVSAVQAVAGVSPRLVAVQQISGGWEVIVGGGDPYQVAGAIYSEAVALSNILGSTLAITGISAATNAVITTNYNSQFAVGTVLTVTGASPTAYNTTYTVTSVSGQSITTSTNTSTFGAYTSGATFSPNPRNVTAAVIDAPNSYSITFVNPTAHTTTVAVTWNTTLAGFAAAPQVNQLGATAILSYINSIPVGQPINELEMISAFQVAVASVLPTLYLTTLTFAVTVDGSSVSPGAGTSIIASDPEGYFSAVASGVTVTQG